MKKTLLALAAIAASSAAFAQSSVTLYGVVDLSLENVKGDKSVTKVSSSNLSSSRLGFKGTEDLGSGLKANFQLESAVSADTGAVSGNFFSRQSWVGLAGGFGDLRLGRTDTPIGDIAGNVLSAQAYDDLKIVGTRAGNDYRRASNAITYFLPALVPGLTASLQYSTGTGTPTAGEVAGSSEGRGYGLGVKYAAGPLSAGIGYQYAKDETAGTAVRNKANATLAYAGVDFGAAKVTAYYNAETGDTARLKVYGAKVAVPFSPEFSLIAGASIARNIDGVKEAGDNAEIVTIKGIYSLSKRTSVYGMFTNVNNNLASTADVGEEVATAGKVARGLAVGINHKF